MIRKYYYFFALMLLCSLSDCRSQTTDSLEFQPGFPGHSASTLEQLKSFPSPRYKPGNNLIRLFNWMNPNYLGGGGQPGINKLQAVENAVHLQEELITHWNYFLFIPNSTYALDIKTLKDPSTSLGSYIRLANQHPEIPLGTTIFWMQLQPMKLGFPNQKANVIRPDFPDKFYIKDNSGKVIKKKLSFAAPDSLFIADGQAQKKCIQNLLSCLKRPINLINENGEEPPGVYGESTLSGDEDILADKKKLAIDDWHIYVSVKKQHFRELYSSQFMSLPELKNTWFTVYCVEGGPIDRFDWNSTKRTCSLINGNYYSTPDFYPRKPDNWRTWKGAWHGWKWINDGRKVEIKNGDRFFSPFISAGWANDARQDIRPGQWLGLLKCMSVIGAEFYYVAYFNLKEPFTKPEDYVWQAAIPAYAQAVTSRYTDIFRNGNVLFDDKGNPIVTYPLNDKSEKDILVTVRKHETKEQYIIAATIQPESNTEHFPLKKNVEISIGKEKFIIESRRQGSVYFLDKSVSPYVFYQLDKWHQYEHPMRWRQDLLYEAEVNDTSSANIKVVCNYKSNGNTYDMSSSESMVLLNKNQWIGFYSNLKNAGSGSVYIKILADEKTEGSGMIIIDDTKIPFKNTATKEKWISVTVPAMKENTLIKIQSESDGLKIDKVCFSNQPSNPDLSAY